MAAKRLRIPRGRPKKEDDPVPFLQNPERSYVMILRATMTRMTHPSIRAASNFVAAELFGNRAFPEDLTPEGRAVMAACPGWQP